MNAKKGHPASLTSSLLARKGEAQPARLADGSAPRDVMALHEEIVARLADEIAQDGRDVSGLQMGLSPIQSATTPEPRFDFADEPEIESVPQNVEAEDASSQSDAQSATSASYYQAPVLKDDLLADDVDTDFDYDGAEAASDAPRATPTDFGELRPSEMRSSAGQADRSSIRAQEVRFEAADLAPPKVAPQSAFVSLRAASDKVQSEDAAAIAPQQKVVASLPMAFAVMVAIAIGGGLGLWVAGSLGTKDAKPSSANAVASIQEPVPVASEAEPVDATPVEAAPDPLVVPEAGDVVVAPIDTPAAPRNSAPVPKPAPVAAPKKPEVTASAAPSLATLTGAYGVQLLSTPKESDASAAWDRLIAKNHAALGQLPHEVVRADLGAKGIYYRVQAGNFDTQAEARALCKSLAAAKQACFVIKR